MNAHRTTLALCLILISLGTAAAEGAGGVLLGLVDPDWNPDFLPAASSPRMEFMGGYGYGVTRDDFIIGGFGFAS